ncbi:SsgA family sporulation/cell division regulator [Streptomyces chartreusis]|uniref:SsgA family sporulation/cell division regulator n=1 Tax=Streptomyces chartreusis TaxID=1969 RepID=UPI002E804BE9|nr:SsgA family sporulation/cell division regulator [Streptomyces chartreusis]WUB15198.1 SsgA family sporulation/cell division regulator [Streptomyces chartreusis]
MTVSNTPLPATVQRIDDDFDALLAASSLGAPHVAATRKTVPEHLRQRLRAAGAARTVDRPPLPRPRTSGPVLVTDIGGGTTDIAHRTLPLETESSTAERAFALAMAVFDGTPHRGIADAAERLLQTVNQPITIGCVGEYTVGKSLLLQDLLGELPATPPPHLFVPHEHSDRPDAFRTAARITGHFPVRPEDFGPLPGTHPAQASLLEDLVNSRPLYGPFTGYAGAAGHARHGLAGTAGLTSFTVCRCAAADGLLAPMWGPAVTSWPLWLAGQQPVFAPEAPAGLPVSAATQLLAWAATSTALEALHAKLSSTTAHVVLLVPDYFDLFASRSGPGRLGTCEADCRALLGAAMPWTGCDHLQALLWSAVLSPGPVAPAGRAQLASAGRQPAVPRADAAHTRKETRAQDVAASLTGLLHLGDRRSTAVRLRMAYRAGDPYAIHTVFRVPDGRKVVWNLARELLITALHQRTGRGDVEAWSQDSSIPPDRRHTFLKLHSVQGAALLAMPTAKLHTFLTCTQRAVALGSEKQHLGAFEQHLPGPRGRSERP